MLKILILLALGSGAHADVNPNSSYPELRALKDAPDASGDPLNFLPPCEGTEKLRMYNRLNNEDLFTGYPDAAQRWYGYVDEAEIALGCTNE